MNDKSTSIPRVIGLDLHPDTFTAVLVEGRTPAEAIRLGQWDKVPNGRLVAWACKHTTSEDLFLLEASGNSFHIVRELAKAGRRAKVLESHHLGKLKEAHANNDKISALRIAKAYLAGTAREVWVPDEQTQQRRECLAAYQKAVAQCTRARNSLRSYLSDQGVRLERINWNDLPKLRLRIELGGPWTPHQKLLLEDKLGQVQHAQEQRARWHRHIATEVLHDPRLLNLVRLCGIREILAYALGALVADIDRFATPKKLVGYIGLSPAFDLSGQGGWEGGLARRGRKDLRGLMIQSAQSIMRSTDSLATWGKKVLRRKGVRNVAVAAVARKLAERIWYFMKGKWEPSRQMDDRLGRTVGKIISNLGQEGLKALGQTRRALRAEVMARLLSGPQLTPK